MMAEPYVRHGPTTQIMPRGEYEKRILDKLHAYRRWENELVPDWVTIKDLDEEEILGVVSGYLAMVMGHNLKVDAAVKELARKTGRPVDKVYRLVEGRAYKFSPEVRTYRKYGLLYVLSSVLVWNMADQVKEWAKEN